MLRHDVIIFTRILDCKYKKSRESGRARNTSLINASLIIEGQPEYG